MLDLIDGPCKGTYMCKRAPIFLRAVKDKDGNTDVLDLREDTPRENETIYVYRLQGDPYVIHINLGGGRGGWYAGGGYQHLPEVNGELLRDNVAWQKWATEQAAKV
jgi:hypothetical protein